MIMTWYDIFGFSFVGTILAIMAIGISFSSIIPTLDKWNKRYFIVLFSLLLACAVTCFLALIFWYDPTMAATSRIIYIFEDIFLPSAMVMPAIFLLHSCKEKVIRSPLFIGITAILGVYFFIVILAPFTEAFYSVTPDNKFIRGPLWALSMSPLVAILLLDICAVLRRRKKLPKKYFIGLIVYLLPMTVAMFIHMFFTIEIFVVAGMVSFALIMYGFILSDNVESYMRQQREISHQRASIMVLQMRPHFIYNSMMGIYYLCDQDPEKAKQVTLDFTTYLRKNFAAIASENTIPFTEELEHTRAFLAVEQAQFEDSLFVDFDTPYTLFSLPPLTLQPIVENAVVHGMRESNQPIHISVITRKTEKAIEIVVEDDGPGFGTTENNDPHIALNNIRGRLKMMCGGALTVSSRNGGGTSVKITLPVGDC